VLSTGLFMISCRVIRNAAAATMVSAAMVPSVIFGNAFRSASGDALKTHQRLPKLRIRAFASGFTSRRGSAVKSSNSSIS
jgi:hypothetical protein